MPIRVTIALESLERYVIERHGSWRQLDVPEIREIQRGMRDVIEAIQDQWLVETGFSRDQWTFETELNRRPFSATIINEAFYSQWVHRAGGSPESPLWETLVPAVVSDILPDAIARARAAVDRTEALLSTGGAPETRGLLPRPPRVRVGPGAAP